MKNEERVKIAANILILHYMRKEEEEKASEDKNLILSFNIEDVKDALGKPFGSFIIEIKRKL